MRDDFNQATKETLARRVGYRCSNPSCRQPTSGPQVDPTKAINIGIAAHITAASPGGARYDPDLSPNQRKSIDNGIWLCQNCAKLVDNDETRYTAELLHEWKSLAEQRALLEIEQQKVADDLEEFKGAALVLEMAVRDASQPAWRGGKTRLRLDVAITSSNEITSENGAFKLTVARPVVFSGSTRIVFRAAHFDVSTGLYLDGYDVVPHAESMVVRWGASRGTVIFPGDWHDFYGNPVYLDAPGLSLLPKPTYLIQTELFTVSSPPKRALFSIQRNNQDAFEMREVNDANYHSTTEAFWATYHAARENSRE